jgi:hypothetical protein
MWRLYELNHMEEVVSLEMYLVFITVMVKELMLMRMTQNTVGVQRMIPNRNQYHVVDVAHGCSWTS